MVVFAGQGDARRSMELLWRAPAPDEVRPGPKPALTLDAILDAAIAIADEQGMDALSMRAVGQRVGRTGMALYTYVPNKNELIDLMYDRVHAELPDGPPADDGWRPGVEAWAGELWAFYQRHPWVLRVSQVRPVLGPHEYAVVESAARILRVSGLSAPLLLRTISTLFHFVRGAAQTVAEARLAARATGTSNEDWWFARSALMPEVAPDFARRYPTIVGLSTEDTFRVPEGEPYLEAQAAETFRVGLGLILDGVEAALPGTPRT
ncbi:TetR family transcriptional regulator [Actinophytocola xinjiangensis]|uniref:TetR family transcriptional regulator n=1 Tax=Actinophytocola xinjiangensis TaxID=485602 RepID=A0A7Z1AWP2_9PSEU|nr:TetR/AcrR family transcriptional regulator C-terminal domain-containing protein [Actinophytocola xinjiangensis]OLF08040.1 TetR family transcriptional regulator [Actinophytocola xinjiangensis]